MQPVSDPFVPEFVTKLQRVDTYAEIEEIMKSPDFIMAGAHFGHDAQIGNKNVFANDALLAGHVHVGNNAFIGGGAVFHQFLRKITSKRHSFSHRYVWYIFS